MTNYDVCKQSEYFGDLDFDRMSVRILIDSINNIIKNRPTMKLDVESCMSTYDGIVMWLNADAVFKDQLSKEGK